MDNDVKVCLAVIWVLATIFAVFDLFKKNKSELEKLIDRVYLTVSAGAICC